MARNPLSGGAAGKALDFAMPPCPFKSQTVATDSVSSCPKLNGLNAELVEPAEHRFGSMLAPDENA